MCCGCSNDQAGAIKPSRVTRIQLAGVSDQRSTAFGEGAVPFGTESPTTVSGSRRPQLPPPEPTCAEGAGDQRDRCRGRRRSGSTSSGSRPRWEEPFLDSDQRHVSFFLALPDDSVSVDRSKIMTVGSSRCEEAASPPRSGISLALRGQRRDGVGGGGCGMAVLPVTTRRLLAHTQHPRRLLPQSFLPSQRPQPRHTGHRRHPRRPHQQPLAPHHLNGVISPLNPVNGHSIYTSR